MAGFEREGTEAFPMGGWVPPAPQPGASDGRQPARELLMHLEQNPVRPEDVNLEALQRLAPLPAPRTTGIDLSSGEVLAFDEHFFIDESALNDINAILLGALARIYESRLGAIAATLQLPDPQGLALQSPSELPDPAVPEASREDAPVDKSSSPEAQAARRPVRNLRQKVSAPQVPSVQVKPPPEGPDAPTT